MAVKKSKSPFKRVIGGYGALAISIGGVIGSGIFFIIGIAAGYAGSGVILSIFFAGIIALLTALSFATLAKSMTKEGGEYDFVYEVFGKKIGYLVGLMWIAATVFAGVTVSLAFASYLNDILPIAPVNVIAAGTCIAFMLLDILGLRLSADIEIVLSIVKIGVLLLFIAIALPAVHASNLSGLLDKGPSGLLVAAFLIFFAYAGFGKVAAAAEEVGCPKKAIPRAILIAVVIAFVLYLMVTIASVGSVGANTLALPSFSGAPLANVMLFLGSEWGFLIILIGALAATSSVLIVELLGVSRTIYAMSANSQLPAFFAKVHPRLKTPYRAEIIIGLVMAAMALMINVVTVVGLTGLGMLLYYCVINLAAIWMHIKEGKALGAADLGSVLGALLCVFLIAYFLSTLLV
jgi:APA family basic amino acid/polyamine antiporter